MSNNFFHRSVVKALFTLEYSLLFLIFSIISTVLLGEDSRHLWLGFLLFRVGRILDRSIKAHSLVDEPDILATADNLYGRIPRESDTFFLI